MRQILVAVVVIVVISMGCSSRVLLSTNDLQERQTVKLELRSGESVKGKIVRCDDQILVVKDGKGKQWRAKKSDIVRVTGPEPVYDFTNKIISEDEIARQKTTSNNALLYSFAGGGLSLGASFFIGSMISRAGNGDLRDGMIWGITGVGTVVGTYLFAKKGAKKDRLIAIDKIKEQRANGFEGDLDSERERRMKIQQEIERLKKEREKQQSELESMKKELKPKEQ